MSRLLEHAAGVSIKEVLPQSRMIGGECHHFTSCCDDPAYCRPGDVFVAVEDRRRDGHDHAEEAVRRGAVAVVAERLLPLSVPVCVVPDSRAAFGKLCHALVGEPTLDLHTIGVSGTHGKTVTSLLIAAILEAAEAPVGVINSIGFCDGRRFQMNTSEQIHPTELARWLGSMRDHGCTHAVVESRSTALAGRHLEGVHLDAAVMTNIQQANLQCHGSIVNYRRAEERLFSLLKPEGFAVLNADDPGCQRLTARIQRPVLTYGVKAPAEIQGRILETHHGDQMFLLTVGRESIPIHTPLIGAHHVSHCLAAAGVTKMMGVDLPTIARGLESVRKIPGRMENICYGQDFPVYLDTTNTSDGLAAVLRTLRPLTSGKLICVLGLPTTSDKQDRPRMGRTLERMADIGIITGAHHGEKLPLPIAHDILDGYDRPAIAHLIPNREQALQWALRQARAGDTLCVLGRNDDLDRAQPSPPYYERDREWFASMLAVPSRPRAYRFAA